MTGISRRGLLFQQDPTIKIWASKLNAETTKNNYCYRLMLFLQKITKSPEQFKSWIDPDINDYGQKMKLQKDVAIEIEGHLKQIAQDSPSAANLTKKAILSFAREFKVQNFPLTMKINVKRVRLKKRFTWDEAITIIEKTPSPYREVLYFMLYAGLDEHSFTLINTDSKSVGSLNGGSIWGSINEQLKNEKTYVSIYMPPRKSSTDQYLILVPKLYVPKFPALTILYRGRGSKPIRGTDLQAVWKRSARKAGLWYPGLGPHHLRSAFRSKCQAIGIDGVAELQLGHNGDKLGYAREGLDENFMLHGPQKNGLKGENGLLTLWSSTPTVDRLTLKKELEERDKRIDLLERKFSELIEATPKDVLQKLYDPKRKKTAV